MRVLGFCIAAIMASGLTADETRPNIILMMADDMGMGDTSAYQDVTGNGDAVQLHTPNMERLARMGIRFTDAHTPTSRCTGTRYGLMTGRYPWRNRLKHYVLFGVQGDPMIERDRPTIASLLKDHGYQTGLVGKWHIGLRYRQSDGKPADAWKDADLTQPLYDTPLDHGFDFCRFTSRSHGTSGVSAGGKKAKNQPNQRVGPGHIHGRIAVSATGNGKQLKPDQDPDAYVLSKLGSRHSDHAASFLEDCVSQSNPFFLYYASNSNHGPYTPDSKINGKPILGAARNVAGQVMMPWKNPKSKKAAPKTDLRHDFIYENDVVLGRMIDYLSKTDDPRRPGHPLIENTIIIFTSDNGAERKAKYATGPFRSNKGSAYEGGHRVPFIVAWPHGNVGDGDDSTDGQTSEVLMGLQDLYATFSHIIHAELPALRSGEKGGEDSTNVLAAWQGDLLQRGPLFHNDHSEAKDKAAIALRIDNPSVAGTIMPGKWKLFFDGNLIRLGIANPTELYDLASDPKEQNNRIAESGLASLVSNLTDQTLLHRQCGGHRFVDDTPQKRAALSWMKSDEPSIPLADAFASGKTDGLTVDLSEQGCKLKMTFTAMRGDKPIENQEYHLNERGLGVGGGTFGQVDDGEAIVIRFDQDVFIESAAIIAGNGHAGGYYQVGGHSPLAIYCVDDDIDYNDQSGKITDIGFLKAGEPLRLDTSGHYGVEKNGRWRLGALTIRFQDDAR